MGVPQGCLKGPALDVSLLIFGLPTSALMMYTVTLSDTLATEGVSPTQHTNLKINTMKKGMRFIHCSYIFTAPLCFRTP